MGDSVRHTSFVGRCSQVGLMAGGDLGPTGGPIACMDACKPEIAALNCGSLNYLKTKKDGTWAWPPMSFDNPVEKVGFLETARYSRLHSRRTAHLSSDHPSYLRCVGGRDAQGDGGARDLP